MRKMRLVRRRPPIMDGLEDVTRNIIWNLTVAAGSVDVFELQGFLEHIVNAEVAPIGATMRPPLDEGRARALVAAAFTAMFRSGSLQMQTDKHALVIVALNPPKQVR